MKITATKKGFTLIEMIITVVILFIVLGILSPLLNYNLKSLYTTENKNDLQREGYGAMENFTKKAMEARNISEISTDANRPTDLHSSVINEKKEIEKIKYIQFITDGDAPDTFTFKLDEGGNLIMNDSSTPIAQNVSDIIVKPLPLDSNDLTGKTSTKAFNECSGIKITFKFCKHLVESYEVTSEVKFRNN